MLSQSLEMVGKKKKKKEEETLFDPKSANVQCITFS